MAKRGAESSLTKNNWEEEADGGDESGNEGGGFAEASTDKLAGRTFVKARRKGEEGGEETKTETEAKTSETPATSEAAPATNPFFALLDPSDWECPTCEVRNKKALLKCAACEAPKPGAAPAAPAAGAEVAKAPEFNFGFSTTPFTFGSTTAGTGFTFGSDTGTTFGSGATFGTGATWGFGATSTTTTETTTSTTSTGFSFGTSDTTFTFGSGAATVTFGDVSGTSFGTGAPTAFETTDQLATGGDQTKEEFKNKEAEPSGTDKDVTIFKLPTTVYTLSTVEGKEEGAEKKKFVECGEGELKINTVQDADKKFARVVLRVEKTQRLVLNAPLFSGMTLGLQGDKYVKFCSNDPEGKVAVYLLRFKNKTESTQVKDHMEKAIAFTTN